MGGAASKGARQLPKSVPTQARAAPEWAKTVVPPEAPLPPPPRSNPLSASASSTSSSSASSSRTSDRSSHGRLERGSGLGSEPRGAPIGRSNTQFSGEKDDTVMRDALDPDFAANLSRIGQVRIQDAGEFVPTQAAAQRTLNSRRNELQDSSSIPPPNHLSASVLRALLDEVKGVRSASALKEVYERYNMSPEKVDQLRRWVNTPSVGDVTTNMVDGQETTEMKAVWVDGKFK